MKNNKLNGKRKMILMTLLGAAAVIVIAFTAYSVVNNRGEQNMSVSFVAEVNGDPISIREFKNALMNQRTGIFTYFQQKYGAGDSSEFWTKSFDGEVPIKLARENALEECILVRIKYALAKREGLLQDTSYSGFLNDLDAENRRRKEAVAKKQVIYGPVQYSENNYYAYTLSNMTAQLVNRLQDKELRVTVKEINLYYEKNKEKYSQPYGEIIDNVKLMYVNEKFEELLARLRKEAKVEIDCQVYDRMEIE